jgi:hypothetical protein
MRAKEELIQLREENRLLREQLDLQRPRELTVQALH